MKPNLLIRADASTQIGTGHVMRCLALAQAWQEAGGDVYFLTAFKAPAIKTRLADEGFNIMLLDVEPGSRTDAEKTVKISRDLGVEWVIVDGYHFDADYQKVIKDNNLKLLFVDDYGHAKHYYADIILNQNIYANEELYPNRETYTRLLPGTCYVLLRREFWPYQNWQRETPVAARKILVTLGGADPDNITGKVIQALQQVEINDLEAIVVVGGGNPHYKALQSQVVGSKQIRLVKNVTNMPELMARADLAISAGGSTCWELAFMGLPNLIITLADNQKPIAKALDQVGVAVNLGWHNEVASNAIAVALLELVSNSQKMIEMSKHGQQLVDGLGGKRIVRELEGRSV